VSRIENIPQMTVTTCERFQRCSVGAAWPVLAALLLLLAACDRRGVAPPAGGGSAGALAAAATDPCACCRPAEEARTARFLDENQGRYEAALARARRWLDALRVEPAELRQAGIKGKKKLVEQLDSYLRLYGVAQPAERAALAQRIKEVAAPTSRPEYHDLLQVGDEVFKQDATSYLRAAYLLEQVGLDTTLYRAEIAKIQPRLDGHMGRRGAHQRMAFHWYYKHFGLTEPFLLAEGFKLGVIAKRLDAYSYKQALQVYDLTHEIFVPYQFGEKLDADFFNEDEKIYLRKTLDRLTVRYIMIDDADLVSELVSCIRFLRFTDLPVYREALGYLLDAQRPEGKWGSYERMRQRLGDLVDQGYYLHTTAVAIDALTVAFHFRPDRPAQR